VTPQAIQQGVSLVLVLVMLVVLGVGAAATLQSALSTERLHTNSQQTTQASQQAETALRSCEAELLKADVDRVASLQEHNIPTTLYQKTPAWTLASTWQTAVKSSNAECVVERQVLADDKQVYVVTARGFGSASRSGTMGTVAWVQSTLLLGSP
jgi:hypothetical protein